MAVQDHAGRHHGPSPPVRSRRLLTVPNLRLGNPYSRIRKSVLIQQQVIESPSVRQTAYLGERLIPVEVGIVHQDEPRAAQAEGIQEGHEIRIRIGRGHQRRGPSAAVSHPSGRARPKPDSRSAASARGSGAIVRISRAIGMVKCRMLMVVWLIMQNAVKTTRKIHVARQ